MITAILLLAGNSSRLNSKTPKQFIKINDKELFLYSLKTFLNEKDISNYVLVVNKEYIFLVNEILKKENILSNKIYIIEGGDSRFNSVKNALIYIHSLFKDTSTIIIHDSARPLVSNNLIRKHIKMSKKYDSISTYIDSTDSLIENKNTYVNKYLNREKIKQLQTPQTFKFDILYNLMLKNEFSYHEETIILKNNGYNIKLVKGSKLNFKVTYKDDLLILKALLDKNDRN